MTGPPPCPPPSAQKPSTSPSPSCPKTQHISFPFVLHFTPRPPLRSSEMETLFPSPSSLPSPARRPPPLPCCCFRREDLKGQTVAVVGMGVSGRAAVRLALARGASVLAIDRNQQWTPPQDEAMFVKDAGKVKLILGECDGAILENVDRVVVSPGVSLRNYGLQTLLLSRTRSVMSELDFAAEVLPEDMKILAVTGTNGKSTVTYFAGQILHHLGIKAFVGGNLGTPLSDAATQILGSAEEIYQAAVVEVSSAQLEIPSRYFHPSVALVLNLTPDHLERHKTMHNYAAMKCRVFSQMKHDKLAVLPAGNQYLNKAFSSYASGRNVAWIGDFPGVMFDMEENLARIRNPVTGLAGNASLESLKAMGLHNYYNAAVAVFAVLGLDYEIGMDSITGVVEKLHVLPHRIQVVCKDTLGVTWVDDSKATNVGATYAALMTLQLQKLIILLGGLAKNIDNKGSTGFEELVELLGQHRGVVTFGNSGAVIHEALLRGGLETHCVRATNLEDAVKQARMIAKCGDTVILSPGCASFDEFKDFEQRGKAFQRLALLSH